MYWKISFTGAGWISCVNLHLRKNKILELLVCYESAYDLSLSQDEIKIDNLGSVNAMTDYLLRRKA